MLLQGRQIHVLVVDDNRDITRTLSLLLKLVGFDVAVAHGGREALTKAHQRRPDVILLDIGLPDLNGYQVAEHLRADEELKTILIIAISGYAQHMHAERSRGAEFDHYFVKPVDISQLIPVIHRALPLS